jgi:hypothetical protein
LDSSASWGTQTRPPGVGEQRRAGQCADDETRHERTPDLERVASEEEQPTDDDADEPVENARDDDATPAIASFALRISW